METSMCILLIIMLILLIAMVKNNDIYYKNTIIIAIIPSLIFIILSEYLIKDKLSVFDNTIYLFVSRWISSNATLLMKVISSLGSALFLIVFTVVVNLILMRKERYKRFGIIIGINLSVVWIMNEIVKFIFQRQRPVVIPLVEASGFSFPSGHSMISMSFYGLIIYFAYISVKRNWVRNFMVSFFSLLIYLIGVSRVYLGVHYASDVLAGFCAGLVWVIGLINILKGYNLIYPQDVRS